MEASFEAGGLLNRLLRLYRCVLISSFLWASRIALNERDLCISVDNDGRAEATYAQSQVSSYRLPAGGLTGRLFELTPRNACSNIPPPPPFSNDSSESWFALVSDFPACPSQTVSNVRNAGYKLIITYNDSHRDLSHEVFDSGFPVVSVAEDYAQYLKNNTLSNSTNDPITLTVQNGSEGDHSLDVVAAYVAVGLALPMMFAAVPLLIHLLFHLLRWSWHNDNWLQLGVSTMRPLDAKETRKLPTRAFTIHDLWDTCAICISDFHSGESVRVLPCTHIFHPQCVDEWLTGHSSLCPLCKAEVIVE